MHFIKTVFAGTLASLFAPSIVNGQTTTSTTNANIKYTNYRANLDNGANYNNLCEDESLHLTDLGNQTQPE